MREQCIEVRAELLREASRVGTLALRFRDGVGKRYYTGSLYPS